MSGGRRTTARDLHRLRMASERGFTLMEAAASVGMTYNRAWFYNRTLGLDFRRPPHSLWQARTADPERKPERK